MFYMAKGKRQLVCMSHREKEDALHHCHDHPGTGGHRGINGTLHKLQEDYYWLGLEKGVARWVIMNNYILLVVHFVFYPKNVIIL